MENNPTKAAFLGLDGTPYTLALDLMERGVMPNLKALLSEGTLRRMDTVMPEVSSVAWTTFMTGVNPGRHGIFGFMELKPGYEMYFPNFSHMKARTLWDRLGESGRSSVVINVPSTYPARPLKGAMTAGFVALDLKKATYPDSVYQYLSGMGYRIDVDTVKARQNVDFLVDDLKLTLARRREAILHFMDNEPWDLFLGVVTETDRLHHYLWDAYADPSHRLHGFFFDYYREIDSLVGEFADRLKDRHPGVPLLIMSDHGFGALEWQVNINFWLKENGYLKLSKEPAQSWEDIGPGTRAFALDPSRVYINLKGKYKRGEVGPEEYGQLCDELARGLMSIEVDGRKVLKAVYKKDEIYSGPCMENAPDLVLLSNPGFDLKGAISRDVLNEKGFLTGMHTQDDAMLYIGMTDMPDKAGERKPSILDVPPTLCRFLAIDGGEMEGTPLV